MSVRNDPTPKSTPKTSATPTPAPTTASVNDNAEDIAGLQGPAGIAAGQAKLSSDHNKIRDELRRSFAPSLLSPNQASAIVAKLATLPAADFRSLVSDMARGPEFDKLNSALAGRKSLLTDLLVSKGMVGVEPANSPPLPRSPRAPVVPSAPSILRDDSKLPPTIREAILKQNTEGLKTYNTNYATYRQAYQEAVKGTKSVAELRAMGPMLTPQTPEHAPGLALSDPNNIKYEEARGRDAPSAQAAAVVADQARVLLGRPVAGMSFSVEGKGVLTVGHGAFGVEISATRTADGSSQTQGSWVGAVNAGGFTVEGSESEQSISADEGQLEIEIASNDKGLALETLYAGTGAKLAIDDTEGVTAGVSLHGFSAEGNFNADRMTFAVAKKFEAKTEHLGIEVEGTVSVGLQGVTKDDVMGFISGSDVGFFDSPPELSAAKAWGALPAQTRADYERQGWTEKEWSSAVALNKATRRAF